MIRRVVLPLLVVLLVLGTTVGGATLYVQRTVEDADNARATDLGLWLIPKADEWPRPHPGRDHTELSALLLPAPEGYRLGPDIGEYGNDAEISGEEAVARAMDAAADAPRAFRKMLEETLREHPLDGIAMRSYAYVKDNGIGGRADLMVEVRVSRHSSEEMAESVHGNLADSLSEDTLFRPGPEVHNHPGAICSYLPRGDDWLEFIGLDPEDAYGHEEDWEALDAMHCTGVVGRHHVTALIQGTAPLRKDAGISLFTAQLDHIESPGMSV